MVTGAIVYFSAFIIGYAAKHNIALTDAQLSLMAAQIGQAIGILYGLFGLVRKIFVKSNDVIVGYFFRE